MDTVLVNTEKKYDVLIDDGLLAEAGHLIYGKLYGGKEISRIKAIVVYNGDLQHFADCLIESLVSAGFQTESIMVPIGEESKNYLSLGFILNKMMNFDFSREDVLISLGGGSVGDVAGFAASIYKRGTRLVHIPTTLLAMVDSAIGGKTALNYDNYKNLIGSFYQPDLVIEDTATLATINDKNLHSGVGEIIKYGVLEKEIFNRLYSEVRTDNAAELIRECVKVKARYVEKDEKDEGDRHFLNLGHTIGHAIETLSGFRTPHGIAVACGIMCLAKCQDAAYCTQTAEKIKKVLDVQKIITEIPFSAEEIIRIANKDKKWAYGKLSLVLFKDIGDCRIQEFTPAEFEHFIKGGLYAC